MVNREFELKFTVPDEDALLNIFRQKDIRLSSPVIQIDTIFLRKGRTFDHLEKGEPVIRIRQEGGLFMTTIKKYKKGISDRVEVECEINDGSTFHEYLELLDILPVIVVKKSRMKGSYKDISICFDHVNDLGIFLEMEIITDEHHASREMERLKGVATELGLNINNVIGVPYDVMLYDKITGGKNV